MKVIQKTEHLLELKNGLDLIVFLSVFFFGFALPSLSFLLFIPSTIVGTGVERFSCKKVERTIATCELSKSSIMGLAKGTSTFFEGVKGTRVEKITDTDMEEVFLVTNKGDLPLPSLIGEDVNLFNKYIQTAVGEFVVEKDNRLLNFQTMLVLLAFQPFNVVIIYLILYFAIIETYIFDKNVNTLIIKRRGILVNEVAERSLDEISEVELETTRDSDGDELYEVRLLMNGGDRLSLGNISNQKEQLKIADWIRSYLDGRSHADRDTSDPGDRPA